MKNTNQVYASYEGYIYAIRDAHHKKCIEKVKPKTKIDEIRLKIDADKSIIELIKRDLKIDNYLWGKCYTPTNHIWVNLKTIHNKSKNEYHFIDLLCKTLTHEYMHHILHEQTKDRTTSAWDNISNKLHEYGTV